MSTQERYTVEEGKALFCMPFMDLLYRARTIHLENFEGNRIQASSLLSIKTGKCPEDCSYCSQSSHYGSQESIRVSKEDVRLRAEQAKKQGATRFCMGASGRGPTGDDLDFVCECIAIVKALGMESCVTLGMLTKEDVERLSKAGLDYYNHNIDTSPDVYTKIITTRSFEERIETIRKVQEAGINVCAGGILGMGEKNEDRIEMLTILANLPTPPQSVPINKLIPIPNTPLKDSPSIDPFDFIRTIALARIMMPKSYIRLSAGRDTMEDTMQALCFFAGANSIFIGNTLLTASNAPIEKDRVLLERLGISLES